LISYSLNLSKGGVFLETTTPLPQGTDLSLHLDIPGADQAIVLEGRVMWTREEDDEMAEPPGMGIAFDAIDEHVGELIDQLVTGFPGIHILLVAGKSRRRPSQIGARLRSLLTCRVSVVGGAISAIDELADSVDLIVADLDHAGQEGISLLQWLREKAERPVPLVAVASDEELRRRALELGAEQVTSGHGPPAEFRGAVLQALSRPLVQKETD
jgi:uncharacterized protein (TIGR02266 family)